ncbi:MAG: hypothetical protein IJ230_05900 [Clostridia bacterium]|nr:hypothetical protein [Clostridia bacterium]
MAERSTLYPIVTWEASLDFIKVIDSFKYKLVSYSEVAKKLGLSNITTKSFTGKISTAKQFGLISTSNKTIQLTETAKSILYPTEKDTLSIAVECFKNPPLYAKLIERYEGKALPSKDVLSNTLMMEYRITQSAKDNAAQVFLDSAEYLGLIQGGVLCFGNDVDRASESTTALENNATSLSVPVASSDVSKLTATESDYIWQRIPTSSGKIAEIKVPTDADKDDLLLIQDMLHSIMRRKFHINPSEFE